MKRIISITTVIILVVLASVIYWRYYFVFGEGVKAGNLNFVVHKGYVFKTWEGRVIQTGIKSTVTGSIQSNEFDFSIASDSIATRLERSNGKIVELRYKEYLHALPWRGNSKYVVTEILNIREE
jgi:hypothetical protein